MSASGITAEEISNAVTGYDEIAVTKHLDLDVYLDGEAKPIMLMRALIFVHLRHQGTPDKDAKDQALGMPLREVNEYFEPEPDDVMPDDPDSEAGKDESVAEPPQSA